MYASETNQNCKNPAGHIDTLRILRLNTRQIKVQLQRFA